MQYVFGATLKTRFSDWKDDPKLHRGIPSTLEKISSPVIREGSDGEDYAEIIVPDSFEPGSIMVFATDMSVRLPIYQPYVRADLVSRRCLLISMRSANLERKRRTSSWTWWTSTSSSTGRMGRSGMPQVGLLPPKEVEADLVQVVTVLTRFPSTVHSHTAVWRGGCIPSARSSIPTISVTRYVRISEKVLGRWIMSFIVSKSTLLLPAILV